MLINFHKFYIGYIKIYNNDDFFSSYNINFVNKINNLIIYFQEIPEHLHWLGT